VDGFLLIQISRRKKKDQKKELYVIIYSFVDIDMMKDQKGDLETIVIGDVMTAFFYKSGKERYG